MNVIEDEKKALAWLPGCFAGQTVYCVGSGPSLEGFDFKKLADKNTIAANHAYLYFRPKILVALDVNFFDFLTRRKHNVADIADYVLAGPDSGQKIGGNVCTFRTSPRNVRTDLPYFYSPALSGMVAINAAIYSGAKKIILLGYDATENHFYSKEWVHPSDNMPRRYARHAKHYDRFSSYRHMIVNACPGSTIESFKRIPLSEVSFD